MKFINLHAHSEASIADGLFSPKRWVGVLKDRGAIGHALTDHGVMTNLLPFYKLMKDEKMSPIMGSEFYFVDDPTIKTPENRRSSHMIILAKNYDGFRNMMKLSKLSFTEGFYYKNRIGLEWLKQYSEGLICLTACQGGVLSNQVWNEFYGRPTVGLKPRFEELTTIFGDDLYVEFQGHNTPNSHKETGEPFDSQKLINEALYKLKGESGFKQIVTNDCHYILPEHAKIQKLIKETSWRTGNKEAGESATVTKDHFTDSLWLKSPEQILEAFARHHSYLPTKFVEDGMHNTIEVLEKCKDFEMPKDKRYLPIFRPKLNSKEIFRVLTTKSLAKFLKSDNLHASKEAYLGRFKKEYRVISTYGLEDYFLIVWDLIRYARTNGIYVGLGRGSAAGCFISYLLGIVKIDPLEHKLLFERFLNANRCESGELPDIDLDFESDRRNEIKRYIFETYGEEHVCEIGTYGRMKLKTSLIDFGKAIQDASGNPIATQKELLEITTKLDLDKEDVDDVEAAANSDPKLMALFRKYPEYCFMVEEIIGQIKSQGVHPAGVVICSDPIAEITPVKTQKTKKDLDEDEKEKRILTTQSEDKYVIAQGLMKMDILGLKEYDVIRYVLENAPGCPYTVEKYAEVIQKQERDRPNIKVWEMFQRGKTEGVFQFASDGMKQLLIMMNPNCINDLIAANALYRPGCLENGWHIQYCKRKSGEESVEYVHADLEAALGDTYGVIVFQEQFMEAIHRLGGISLIDSDIIRSALGKKDKKKLDKFKERFVDGASTKIGEKEANALWDQIEKASGYSFNKSHSAVYSVLAYISQFLKVTYPAYFWAAQLEWDTRKGKREDMLVDRRAAAEMGVKYILPEINISKSKFYVRNDNKVVWSFRGLKGLGPKAVDEIEKNQPYADFDDFYKRVNKSKVKYNNIEALIYAGAFDEMGDRRELLKYANSLRKKPDPKSPEHDEESLMLKFYESVGFFEQKLKRIRKTFSKTCITESELRDYEPGEYIKVGGMITDLRSIKTKKGDPMGFATLMDLDEIIELTIFPQQWAVYRTTLKVGSVIEVGGRKSSYNGKQNLIEVQEILEV